MNLIAVIATFLLCSLVQSGARSKLLSAASIATGNRFLATICFTSLGTIKVGDIGWRANVKLQPKVFSALNMLLI